VVSRRHSKSRGLVRGCVTIHNYAHQKLFPSIVTHPHSLLPLSLTPTRSSHCHSPPLAPPIVTHPHSLLPLSLTPTCSSRYPLPHYLSSITLNCTFLILVSWITCSLPPYHLSCIVFIEDTDDTQHKVACPALQMYLCDGSCRGPDVLVACAPTCFANAQLDHNPVEHYPCSTSLLPNIPCTSQTALNRQPLRPMDFPLDALDGHGSISEIPL
jgi:hypothetical protein